MYIKSAVFSYNVLFILAIPTLNMSLSPINWILVSFVFAYYIGLPVHMGCQIPGFQRYH